MRRSNRRPHDSIWLKSKLDELHADLRRREIRYRRIAGWSFVGFIINFSAVMQWPIHVGGTIGTIGFWLAILLGGIWWYTWHAARIEASLMDIPLELHPDVASAITISTTLSRTTPARE